MSAPDIDDYPTPPRVAVQGDSGCFSESAAQQVLGDRFVTVPCETFEQVVAHVKDGRAEYGVVPILNSIAGPVEKGRAALAGTPLPIVTTIVLPIEQCLLVVPGATVDGLLRVISHPVALAQCGVFFSHHPSMTPTAVWDTAGAAREVATQGDPTLAAIASRRAAAVHGLEVARAGIGDRSDNATTFVVVTAPKGD